MSATAGLDTEHQDLLQFLYAAPVGLVHASASGEIDLINSAAARWLLPLAPGGKLDNLFSVLGPVAPGLREAAARRGAAPGVIVDHLRIEVTGGRRRREGPEFVAMTLTQLDDRRLMAAFSDITQQVRDERALGDSEAHYRAVVSVLSEGIVLHDHEGRLLMCNATAEHVVGAPLPAFQSGTALARRWAPLWPDGRPMAAADTPTGIVLAGGPPQDHVAVLSEVADGDRRWFEVSARPVIRPGTGDLLAVVTSFTDVTQRRRLEEELHHHREHLQELVTQRTRELEASNVALAAQQRMLRSVADAVPGLIGYWDTELRCRFSNQAYVEWFGKAPGEMTGMRLQDLLGEELFALNRPHVEAALRGQTQHFQRSITKPDGAIGHTLASYIPDFAAGRVRGFNVVLTDVTELKQAEFRLETLNVQLLQRAAQADEATRAKSAFLANMSHEIRTPMNAIVGLSHLMRRDALDPLQQARLLKINDASQHLLQLINDILDLSKIDAGKMTLDDAEFDTHDVLRRALGMVIDQAHAKGLAISLDGDALPARLRGDAVRLSQCLINLLTNAVKFTERGSVRLRGVVTGEPGPRAWVRFEVRDTGPGIAPDRQAVLFNTFEQADNSSTRRHGGTGLGLALTRHFARLMGGEAGVASEPGVGSTFWFTASLGTVAEAGEAKASHALHGLRALVIDDHAETLQATAQRLGALGLAVDAQPGGASGLHRLAAEMIAGRPYDLVLVAQGAQPADALATLDRIRQLLGAGAPPCLLVAERADAAVVQQAHEAGFDAVLARPIEPAALEDALNGTPQPPGRPAEPALLRPLAGRRVLVVEDHPVNQEVAVELLTLAGLQVETADNGAQAITMLRERRFDAVLMDVQMPVMDGLSSTRELRRSGNTTPILAMTALAFGEERAACLAAGMNDHVSKPVNPEQLYATLTKWLPPAPAAAAPGAQPPAGPSVRSFLERLAAVSGLDVAAALRAVGGEPQTLARVLTRFAEVYAPRDGGAAFGRATSSNDGLKSACHSLRGACASIGAVALQGELAVFERELDREGDTAAHQQRAGEIEARLARLVGELTATLGR